MKPGAVDASGQLYIVTVAPSPASALGGVTLSAKGQVFTSATNTGGTVANNGFRFNSDGSLLTSGAAITSYVGGLPFAADGSLVVQQAAPAGTDPYVGGVRVGASGVFVTTAVPP